MAGDRRPAVRSSVQGDEEAFDADGSMTRLFDRGDGAANSFAVTVALTRSGAQFAQAVSRNRA
jgi:hypothetical protein